jgi:hypothetical protein
MNGFRPPNYSPGFNAALMDDPMALTFMMFGAPMLQQAAGPGNFVPHLTPSQALSDQFLASRYQRDQLQSMNGATQQGNSAVASRFLGLRSLVTDAPATQLNREQAAMFAGVANNPIAKAVMASVVGPETMEGLMFGRRGDPAALANSANKVNFFRRDTTGATRMSGDSMQEVSQNLYENLYGGKNVDDMHGFTAGQTGAAMEHLFQSGQLPQSLGEMSAADRVRVLSGSQRDDATMDRLARQFGHKEMLKQESYANATAPEQERMLDAQVGQYRQRLDRTFTEIDRHNSNDPRARSAQQIEQMDGYGMAARNVDSQRVGQVAKNYMGALDAVREIFGDNGKGDAPIEALIEALDEFSSGSINKIDPSRVERTMREMRSSAKSAGVNLESMAMIGANGTALAQMYGTPSHMQMDANLQTTQQLAAMQQTGMFSRKIYGDLTEGEAIKEAQSRIYRGQQSEAGKSMSALNRMYQQNRDMYAGTELEAAMQAYNDPNSGGEYTYNGQRRNIADATATRGRGGALDILQNSGGNTQTFNAFYHDPGTAEQYSTGLELTAQKREMTRDLANRVINGELSSRMSDDRFDAVRSRGFLGIGGQSQEAFERERNDMAATLSRGFAQVIVDETGGMTSEERAAHLESRHVDMMAQYYESRGYSASAARSRAETASAAMFGETAGQRREALSGIAAQSNTYVTRQTGQQISANDQITSDAVQQRVRENKVDAAETAERSKNLSRGQKSSIQQRFGDVLEQLGTNPEYTGEQAKNDILGAMSVDEMRSRYAPEMAASVGATVDMYSNARTDAERERAETIMAGLHDGRNGNARTAAIDALATQAFGRTTGQDADLLRRTIENGSDVEELSRRLPRRQQEQLLAQVRGMQNARRADLAGAGFSQTAAEAAAARDQLNTVGATAETPAQINQATVFNRADSRLTPEQVNTFQAEFANEETGGRSEDVAATVAASAAMYGNASGGTAELETETNHNNLYHAGVGMLQGGVDVGDNLATAAKTTKNFVGGTSRVARFASRSALVARASAGLGAAGRALSPLSRVAPWLSPLLGGVAGAIEGAENGRGAVTGGVLGVITGDASSGSMMSSTLGIEAGSDKDKALGMMGATAAGAMTGAGLGSILPGVGTAAGAVVGGVLGLGAEAYKIFTEPKTSSAAVNAVQQTVESRQAPQATQAATPGDDGRGELTINGTLSLRGMQEVILQAVGARPMETPNGGVPVLGT